MIILVRNLFIVSTFFLMFSCADYKATKPEKKYYFSSGFALIYEDKLFKEGVVNRKIDNEKIIAVHNLLKTGTVVRIINPINSKEVEVKIYKKANYPKIFNIVISKKISSILQLDEDNPYIEFEEIKVNKTFVAKKANTFDEERNVAEKAPVEKIEMSYLTEVKIKDKNKNSKATNFVLIISDFYYKDSANLLMNDLLKKITIKNISVKKINNKKYRLFAGPFKSFNALKNVYISLNNLGFENLNITRE